MTSLQKRDSTEDLRTRSFSGASNEAVDDGEGRGASIGRENRDEMRLRVLIAARAVVSWEVQQTCLRPGT